MDSPLNLFCFQTLVDSYSCSWPVKSLTIYHLDPPTSPLRLLFLHLHNTVLLMHSFWAWWLHCHTGSVFYQGLWLQTQKHGWPAENGPRWLLDTKYPAFITFSYQSSCYHCLHSDWRFFFPSLWTGLHDLCFSPSFDVKIFPVPHSQSKL